MLLKTESYKRGIVSSTFFNILNKSLVFINSLIVAFYFGTQLKTDIYFYAYNTIVILSAFITSLNSSVLIPESMRIRVEEGERQSMHFLNFFLYGSGLITLLICLFLIADPVKAFHLASSFDLKALEQYRKILLLAAPLILLMPLVNLLTDILTSYKYFTIPMLAGIVNGLFAISFIILFHRSLDIVSILAGLLVSYTINLLLLILLMRKRIRWNFSFKWVRIERRIWRNIGFAQLGNISTSVSSYLPLYLLSGFTAGVITSLNYAQQVASIPTTLITNQFSAIAGIKFNELTAKKDPGGLNRYFLDVSNFLIFILVPITCISFLYSDEIFSILYHRGAFGADSVNNSAHFFRYLIILLPMLAVNTLVARLFMASYLIKQAFWYQITLNTVLIVFIYIGIRAIGIEGYFISLVSVYVLSTVLQTYMLKRFLSYIDYHVMLKKFLAVLVINLALLWVTSRFSLLLFAHTNHYTAILVGCCIYFLPLVLLNHLLKVNKLFADIFGKMAFRLLKF